MEYRSAISPKMRKVADVLTDTFVGMDHCVTDTRKNLIVEVPKQRCEEVRAVLKKYYPDVALIKNAYAMMEDLHDFILVKPLISEAPVYVEDGVSVPKLEKLLVDHAADKEYVTLDDTDIQQEYQHAFEVYPINTSRLLRYAARKGKKEEALARIEKVDKSRVETIRAIQDCFRKEPVLRAWLFGSYSRREERQDSDIDILVDLDPAISIGLLQYAGIVNRLEGLTGRKVDLVERASVKPFAQKNICQDSILIYERT